MAQPLRTAVRGLVIDHDDHVLLVRLSFPHGAYWVLPGGGIDDAENHLDALRRELSEETGLVDVPIGAPVWRRTHHFDLVDTSGVLWSGQTETVYLIRTARFDVEPSFSRDELLSENLDQHKWWSIQEMLTYDGPDQFAPRAIGWYVQTIVTHGVPALPFVITQLS